MRLATSIERPRLDAATLQKAGAAFGYVPVAPSRLLVRHGAGHRLTPLSEIARFSAADGVVHAPTAAGAPILDYTLSELEGRTAGQFVRTSRADLVNVGRIDRMVSNGDGSITLTLSDGTAIRVSRRRAARIRQVLESGPHER